MGDLRLVVAQIEGNNPNQSALLVNIMITKHSSLNGCQLNLFCIRLNVVLLFPELSVVVLLKRVHGGTMGNKVTCCKISSLVCVGLIRVIVRSSGFGCMNHLIFFLQSHDNHFQSLTCFGLSDPVACRS